MSESQKNKTRAASQRANKSAEPAATTVAKGPAIQATQTEQDAAALKAAATVVKDLAVQTTKAEQDEEAIKAAAATTVAKDFAVQISQVEQDSAASKAAGVQTELVNQLNPHAEQSSLIDAAAVVRGAAGKSLSIDAAGIMGALKVRAKSDKGFWRAGVQFHRLKETLVVVVEKETKAIPELQPKTHEPENVVFVNAEKAMRIHQEPNLTSEYVDLDEVLTLVEIQQ